MDRVKKTHLLVSDVQNIVLFIIVFLSCLCSNLNSNNRVYILVLIIFLLAFYLLFNSFKVKISNEILTLIILLIVPAGLNIIYMHYYLLNIINIVLITNLILRGKNKLNLKIIYCSIFAYFVISVFYILIFSDYYYANSKYVLGFEIKKRIFQNFNISTYTFTLGYLFFLIPINKSKIFKLLLRIFILGIIIYFGKISVLFGVLISFFVVKSRFKTNNLISISIFSLCYLAPFVMKLFYSILEKNNFIGILSGRNILWSDYVNYIFSQDISSFLFGNGFYADNEISYLLHPHNQYISLFYIGGLFLFLYYYKFLYSTYKKIGSSKIREHLGLLLFLILVQITDDYFILTLYPLPLILILSLHNHSNE